MKKNLMTECMIDRFDLDPDKVFWLQVNNAIAYLEEMHPDTPRLRQAILKTPAFWTWWVSQLWNHRDDLLDDRMRVIENEWYYTPSGTLITDTWAFYQRWHNWQRVQDRPNEVIMHDALTRLYGKEVAYV